MYFNHFWVACLQKILMVVNVSPLSIHSSETINSLRFASEVNSWVLNKKEKIQK